MLYEQRRQWTGSKREKYVKKTLNSQILTSKKTHTHNKNMLQISPSKLNSQKCCCAAQVVEEPRENSEQFCNTLFKLHTYMHIS